MKNFLFVLCALVLIAAAGQVQVAHAAQHQATFVVNVATVPDTMPSTGTRVCMRGDYVSGSWPNDSTSEMTHIGGDYWSKNVMIETGTTIHYKYSIEYAGASGWEQNLGTGSTNREFTMGENDTIAPVEFWNNGPGSNGQYWRPWTSAGPDTEMIYFRVNMGGPITTGTFSFDNNVDQVGVRGGGPAGSDLNWAPTFYLQKEVPPTNSASAFLVPASWFRSGALKFPKSGMTAGSSIAYKFIIGADWGRDELQGGAPNRSFNTPTGLQDTTLQWVFYNNQHPSGRQNIDTCVVTYHVDVAKAVATGGFTIGDTLYARSGYFGTGQTLGKLCILENLIGTIYEGTDTVITAVGQTFDYQYYHVKNGAEVRENYYNFYYSGDQTSEAERRQLLAPSHSFTIEDIATSITVARRQPDFPNARTLSHAVTVTYEVNLKPVYFQSMAGDTMHDIQGSFDISAAVIDSIQNWGVFMNGPAVGGWSNPGGTDWDFGLNTNPDKKMFDDGTHGDVVAGDSIYTLTVLCAPESIAIGTKGSVGQTFKFGVRGGDNEGGKGGYGNNHNENISDLSTTYTMHSQFGSINPAFYNAWNYDLETPASVQVAATYSTGWNLISVPVLVDNGAAATLFPTASSKPFAYHGNYQITDPVNAGAGYWVKFPAGTPVTYTGQVRNSITVPVVKGWNMIGSATHNALVSNITSTPPGLVTSHFFGYTTSYTQATTLTPGNGYWVKVNAAGTLILNSPHVTAAAKIRIVDNGEVPPAPPEVMSSNVLPKEYGLSQNYPNPFNPQTLIKYQLPEDSKVTLRVYNAIGQVVATLVDGVQSAGFAQAEFKAMNLASGVYFYKFDATSVSNPSKGFSKVEKMMLMK